MSGMITLTHLNRHPIDSASLPSTITVQQSFLIMTEAQNLSPLSTFFVASLHRMVSCALPVIAICTPALLCNAPRDALFHVTRRAGANTRARASPQTAEHKAEMDALKAQHVTEMDELKLQLDELKLKLDAAIAAGANMGRSSSPVESCDDDADIPPGEKPHESLPPRPFSPPSTSHIRSR